MHWLANMHFSQVQSGSGNSNHHHKLAIGFLAGHRKMCRRHCYDFCTQKVWAQTNPIVVKNNTTVVYKAGMRTAFESNR